MDKGFLANLVEVAILPGCKGCGRGEGREGTERRTSGEVVYSPRKLEDPKEWWCSTEVQKQKKEHLEEMEVGM